MRYRKRMFWLDFSLNRETYVTRLLSPVVLEAGCSRRSSRQRCQRPEEPDHSRPEVERQCYREAPMTRTNPVLLYERRSDWQQTKRDSEHW